MIMIYILLECGTTEFFYALIARLSTTNLFNMAVGFKTYNPIAKVPKTRKHGKIVG